MNVEIIQIKNILACFSMYISIALSPILNETAHITENNLTDIK